jgi:hypothetical protein
MGWMGKIAPQGHARTVMLRDCGKKCFLGPDKSFPVCAYAVYIRARQWGKSDSSYNGKSRPSMKRRVYADVARKAKKILDKKGYDVE